ncbi:MAG: HD domain-containing phosphohydrolase [Nitrospiraceae bacterium]
MIERMNAEFPKPTVLIVEDEEGPRNALKIILRPFFNLYIAGSQQEALRILQDYHVDLMTLDIRLPDGSGLDLLQTTRRNFPWVETVVITGYGALKTSQEALRRGAVGYLLKPFNVRELITLLNHTLEKKRRLDFVRNFLPSFHHRWTDKRAAGLDWANLTEQYRALPHAQPLRAPQRGQYGDYVPLLSDIFEATDRTLLAHVTRVRGYALLMADPLKLSDGNRRALSMGAFLHDIGRVATSGSDAGGIQGSGDGHPEFGSRMVLPFDIPPGAVQIIRHHHERHDGTGYPHGLKGEAIPLLARIVSLVQSFDELTAPRDDRTPLTVDAAIEQILRESGTGYDPRLAEVFAGQIHETKELLPSPTTL